MKQHASLRRHHWSLASCVAEGLRNFLSGGLRTTLAVVMSASFVFAAALADTVAVRELVDSSAEFDEAGGNVLIANGPLEVVDCLGLSESPGILASVAITRQASAVPYQPSGDTLSVLSVSSGIRVVGRLLEGRWPGGGEVFVSPDTAERFDLYPGRHIWLQPVDSQRAANVLVVGIADLQRLGDSNRAGIGFVDAVVTSSTETCVLETERGLVEQFQEALPALLSTGNSIVRVSPRVPRDEFSRNHHMEFWHRSTRHGWAGATFGLLLLWASSLAGRRSERGLYATIGASNSTIAAVYLTEQWLSVTVGAAIGCWSAMCTAVALLDIDTSLALGTVGRQSAMVVLSTIAASGLVPLLGSRQPVLALIKDR